MESQPLVNNNKKIPEIKPASLFKLTIITSALTYILISIIALCVGIYFFNKSCNTHIQLLLILEAITSFVVVPLLIHMIINDTSYWSTFIFIITLTISFAFIIIGMSIVWPFTENTKCHFVLTEFSFVYFNMWWLMGFSTIIIFISLFLIYRKQMQ